MWEAEPIPELEMIGIPSRMRPFPLFFCPWPVSLASSCLTFPVSLVGIGGRGLGLRDYANTSGVEGVGLYFSLIALSRDLFAVQKEADAGGVSRPYYYFVAGADGGVRGCDQSFFGYGLAVGQDRDPGSFLGADEHGKSDGGLGGSC